MVVKSGINYLKTQLWTNHFLITAWKFYNTLLNYQRFAFSMKKDYVFATHIKSITLLKCAYSTLHHFSYKQISQQLGSPVD